MNLVWNKTKVICTIGPACNSPLMMKTMIRAGMDIARFNFSHGTPEQHCALIRRMQLTARRLRSALAILQDLPGPKIRIGALSRDFIELNRGQRFFLTRKNIVGNEQGVSINHGLFMRGLAEKDIVYLNDGLVKLVVTGRTSDNVECRVVTGGRIYPRKGVSSPSNLAGCSAVTEYDLACLELGIKAGVDFVAISFVQHHRDIEKVKKFLKQRKSRIAVIAKIERKVALQDIDGIIAASDAVMVARGDLGIEAELEEVPFLQKEIIRKCNDQGRPVITATQMLESMVNSPQPTRAEVTDVANAVLDGSDALMLSEETAVGQHPVRALEEMVAIAGKAEKRLHEFSECRRPLPEAGASMAESLSRAAVDVSQSIRAGLIVVPTQNAQSVSWLSRLRPGCVVAGITTSEAVFKKMILFWGVYPILIRKISSLPETLRQCVAAVKARRLVRKNDTMVIMLTKDNQLFSTDIMEVRRVD